MVESQRPEDPRAGYPFARQHERTTHAGAVRAAGQSQEESTEERRHWTTTGRST